MARFVYLGEETETLGFRFRSGEPTEVTDERAIAKLRGNSRFSEVIDGAEVMPDAPRPKRAYTRRKEA